MGQSALYDDDILLWSEEQAELIRRLGRTRRDLPNELDVENVAEEIEGVGRSELAAVESFIELILVQLIKLALAPESDSVRHWRAEIVAFHGMKRRYSDSMCERVDLQNAWRLAREQAVVGSTESEETARLLPEPCPYRLDDFLGERIETETLVRQLSPRPSD